jgi:redox-sensitive bicupin YhaK (pirin superfamily)
MTAGGGILHDELPTEKMYRGGGPAHAVQLWVNLPPALKMTTPRYQSITRDALRLLTSDDGGALIRLIAGDVAGFTGPGVTHTPITYAHVTLAPGAQLRVLGGAVGEEGLVAFAEYAGMTERMTDNERSHELLANGLAHVWSTR